ncbi:hypothetical protein H206_06157 [Candidatus Electrothrix aarhusensis]|uniref:Uncharacterized protein n=1 Tax=Candidatus Electrothrix aarhusensis TaxID=1859131 RepID=A0A444J3U7_9BACT|nr:hypothetical protein H206_06157 [Candidatus Electrothrix aarhusensis]
MYLRRFIFLRDILSLIHSSEKIPVSSTSNPANRMIRRAVWAVYAPKFILLSQHI